MGIYKICIILVNVFYHLSNDLLSFFYGFQVSFYDFGLSVYFFPFFFVKLRNANNTRFEKLLDLIKQIYLLASWSIQTASGVGNLLGDSLYCLDGTSCLTKILIGHRKNSSQLLLLLHQFTTIPCSWLKDQIMNFAALNVSISQKVIVIFLT